MKFLDKTLLFIFIGWISLTSGCQTTISTSQPTVPLFVSATATVWSPKPTATSTPTPQPSPTPRLGCNDQHGKIINFDVQASGFPKPMNVNVYLPPCYSDLYSGGYPVLYLIHGQSFSNDQWIRLGVPEAADTDFLSGTLKPFIVVMPRDEYYLEDWNKSSFGDNLVKGLIPYIDAHYHTCSERFCRAIGGLSRGATWAVVLGLTYWDQFGAIGAHSLPDAPYTEAITRDIFKAMKPQGFSRLYLDIGNVDGYKTGAQRFIGYLEKYNIPHDWHVNSGGHNEDYWSSHVPEYLLWYGKVWN